MKHKIKLIALDLDGTLLEHDKSVLPEVRIFLSKLVKRGVKITTASGRPFDYQVRILEKNRLGKFSGFPHAIIANEQDIFLLTENDYEPLREHNAFLRKRWEELLPLVKSIVSFELKRLTSMGVKVRKWPDTDEEMLRRKIIGLLFENTYEAVLEEQILKRTLVSSLYCNRHFNLVQIMLREAGKGNAVMKLARIWNIKPNEVLCIGDASNDLSMLNCNLGFIPATFKNAENEVKNEVRRCNGYIASQPCGKGILEILSKFYY